LHKQQQQLQQEQQWKNHCALLAAHFDNPAVLMERDLFNAVPNVTVDCTVECWPLSQQVHPPCK
jgi:hypothetical protein